MAPFTRFTRSSAVARAHVAQRWRRSTRWLRTRLRPRLAVPPPTDVAVELHGDGVLEVRLVNGVRRNVLGRTTIDAIDALVASPPEGTRVVVITAEAPDFCAGYDLIEASQGDPSTLIAHEDNFTGVRRSPVPVIAALSGNVIGGGLELALSADLRVASPETVMALPAGRLGLVYSGAGVALLVAVLGESNARAMLLGGRRLDANRALDQGVVTEIVPREVLRERALELGAEVAAWSLNASRANRQVIDAVTGRAEADLVALRDSAFVEGGDLSRSIADFVARRTASVSRMRETDESTQRADT